MPDQTTAPEATSPVADAPKPTEPVATAPEAPKPSEPKSLADLLAGLDDTARAAVLGEVTKARSEAANYRTKMRELEPKAAEYDKVVESQKSAEQKAQEAANAAQARVEALTQRAVKAEVKALAADGFADPEDAAAFLDLSKYATSDGDVDTEALRGDLADLLSRKPHLGKLPTSRVPAPNPAQGASGSGPSGTPQITREQMASMTPAEIDKAYAEGRLAHVLGSK